MQKGYGIGSGISLFIAVNICETIIWKSFSPFTITNEAGAVEYEGAIVSAVHLLVTKPNKLSALNKAFYRQSATNLFNLTTTAVVFLIVVFFQVRFFTYYRDSNIILKSHTKIQMLNKHTQFLCSIHQIFLLSFNLP